MRISDWSSDVCSSDLSTEQFRNVIVSTVNGYPVRLSDVADVQIGPLDDRVLARYNGQPSLTIGITKQATAHPPELSSSVRKEVEEINQNLTGGLRLAMPYDTSVFIQESTQSTARPPRRETVRKPAEPY